MIRKGNERAPPIMIMNRGGFTKENGLRTVSSDFDTFWGFERILLDFNGIVRRVDRFSGTYLP